MDGFSTNIEKATLENEYYRRVIYTTKESQLVLMNIPPSDNIPEEIHPEVSQFIRIESGEGKAILNNTVHELRDGTAIVIPSGTKHQIINTSDTKPLKLYTVYSPPEHSPYRIDVNNPVHSQRDFLTGDRNLDTIILNKLEDKELVRVCRVNKLADKICKDQTFWLNRIITKFPYLSMDVLNKYKKDRSWSEYYINDLRRINYGNSNRTLVDGAFSGRLDHVITALKTGANVQYRGNTALLHASARGYTDIVRYLVEKGANIHDHDDEAIIYASENGYIDIAKYLVSVGANIHALDDEAIQLAEENGHLDVVNYLRSLP